MNAIIGTRCENCGYSITLNQKCPFCWDRGMTSNSEEYHLTRYPAGKFGVFKGPKAYVVPVTDRMEHAVGDEGIEAFLEGNKAYAAHLKKQGMTPLPKGWKPEHAFDILSIVHGEFSPLMPRKGEYSHHQLGRAIMQNVESYSEPEAYVGKESGFPQKHSDYSRLAKWMMHNGLVGKSADEEHTEGYFTGQGVKSARASLKHINSMYDSNK